MQYSVMPQLKIWWIPQIPMKAFHFPVASLIEAKLLLNALAEYDKFQLENRVKGEYCNAGGLLTLEDGEWVDWYDECGRDIDSIEIKELRQWTTTPTLTA